MIKAPDQDKSNEHGQHEVENRCGIVLETMIQRPVIDQSVKVFIFDIPSFMPSLPELTGGQNLAGDICRPPP